MSSLIFVDSSQYYNTLIKSLIEKDDIDRNT